MSRRTLHALLVLLGCAAMKEMLFDIRGRGKKKKEQQG